MEAMFQEITGVKVKSLHHDISTTTGEEVVLFTLAESPLSAKAKRNRTYLTYFAGSLILVWLYPVDSPTV
jgi:hypothetical protein